MITFGYGSGSVELTSDLVSEDIPSLLASARRAVPGQGIVVRTDLNLPEELATAAAEAVAGSDDVAIYVRGNGSRFSPAVLSAFRHARHLNLNVNHLADHGFLEDFTDLRSLTIQGSAPRPVTVGFLAGMPHLRRLSIPAAVRGVDALAHTGSLDYLSCASNELVLQSLVGHPTLRYLDITFGTNRDLTYMARIPRLRGVGIYQVRGLDGDDLNALGDCGGLTALSLGALRNVTHLTALRSPPAATLSALLLENLPNLRDLQDLQGCTALEQLGLYEARPQDKRLAPLKQCAALSHLVLGDAYPKAEIEDLLSWYHGSLHYRDKIDRGQFKPRWRTKIDALDADSNNS